MAAHENIEDDGTIYQRHAVDTQKLSKAFLHDSLFHSINLKSNSVFI